MKNRAELASLQIGAVQITLPIGLVVDMFELKSGAIRANLNPFHLHLEHAAEFVARVTALQIAEFLEKKHKGGIREYQVQIQDGKLFVSGKIKMVVDMKVSAVCTLRIENSNKLFVDLISLSIPGNLAKAKVQKELEKANPLLDLDEIFPTAELSSLSLENDFVEIYGTIDVPQSW